MGKIKVTDREGKLHELEADVGSTIMEIIRDAGLDIEAACGGCCACATCHVYVDPSDFEKLKKAEEDEISTLKEAAIKPTTHSRLGCQIELKKEHNNITVTIAPD